MAGLYGQYLAIHLLEREERKRKIRRLRMQRQGLRDTLDPFSITDEEFIRNFRLIKAAARDLINNIDMIFNQRPVATSIPTYLAVLCTLSFLGHGSYQRHVGNSLLTALSQASVSRCIDRVTRAIVENLICQRIKFPHTNEQRDHFKLRFLESTGMPHVIGAIDGTHIAIIKPRENEHAYVNRKGYHSMNVQIICDYSTRIINIVSLYPGSTHDAFIWRNSAVSTIMRANYENGDTTSRLIGDSGYPCLPWLLVPLRNTNDHHEEHFNNILKRSRSCVERCIGLLKGRFRCLLKDRVLHYNPTKASQIIISCAVLHNIAIDYNVPVDMELLRDDMDINYHYQFEGNEDIHYRNLGQEARRQYIANNF